MIKPYYVKTIILASLISLIMAAVPNFGDNAPPSLADHVHLLHSKDPIDGGWLPDLTGLPDKNQVRQMTQNILEMMQQDKDQTCTSIDWHLRLMIFQHFVIYQKIANAQHVYFNDLIAYQWAHVLGMILAESSGDSSNMTDMMGRSISTYEAVSNLREWREIRTLSKLTRIQLNDQTNFGLTQTSADRLFDAFCLAQAQRYDTEFLEGREGAETPRKINLNTAIAIRRLIWFYQDFAQGRITEGDTRIHQEDINTSEFSARYQEGLDTALFYCGTNFMFRDSHLNLGETEISTLQKAMASIAYCKLGNPQIGYGMNEFDEKCFAAWVTLCPALNIDIATLTPLSYFATRKSPPLCEDTFKQLIIKH